MRLHDPKVEQRLLHCAWIAAGPGKNVMPDVPMWRRILAIILGHPAMITMVVYYLGAFDDGTRADVIQQALCALLVMFTIYRGHQAVGIAFASTGFFSTLTNLPISRRTALEFTRSRLVRIFGFSSIVYPVIAALALQQFSSPLDWWAYVRDAVLLVAVVWSTLFIASTQRSLHAILVRFWQSAAVVLILWLAFLFITRGRDLASGEATVTLVWIDAFLWVFPPAWVFPGKLNAIGGLLASLWIVAGLWKCYRMPFTLFPEYDRAIDFPGAFGTFAAGDADESQQEEMQNNPPEVAAELGSEDAPSRRGWVGKIAARLIHPEDQATAGAVLNRDENLSKPVHLALLLAPVWLLLAGYGREFLVRIIPRKQVDSPEILVDIFVFAIPTAFFLLKLFPFRAAILPILRPYELGGMQVPFFCTLPISVRSLSRISRAITIVRAALAGIIATPFFWLLCRICGYVEIANGLLLAIPVGITAWIFFHPALILSSMQANIKRKRGTFFIHHATGIFYLCLTLLWGVFSIAAVAAAFVWAAGFSEDRYVAFMLPAVAAGLALGAAVAWMSLQGFIFSLHLLRYDWKTLQK